MAFGDFKTIAEVLEKFRIAYTENDFFHLAELVAVQKINDAPDFPVYGIVSDGGQWQFGHLIGDVFTQHRTNFSVDNLPVLFGAVDSVFKATTEITIQDFS